MPVVATDNFATSRAGIDSPATRCFAITKSDTDELAFVTNYLYIGGAGNVAVILEGDDDSVVLTGLAVGVLHKLRVKKVMSSNTTATAIVGLH